MPPDMIMYFHVSYLFHSSCTVCIETENEGKSTKYAYTFLLDLTITLHLLQF